MRITSIMVQANITKTLNNQMDRLYKINNDVSSGVRIHKGSDDPFGTSLSLRYDEDIDQTEQWIKNSDSGKEWIAHTTQILDQVQNVTQQIYSKAIQGDNDTITQEEKDTLALLINEQLEEIVDLTNNSYNGKKIFNGDIINASPFYAVKNKEGDITNVAVFNGFVDGNPQNPEYIYYREENDGSHTGIYIDKNGKEKNIIANDQSFGNVSISGSMNRRVSSSEIVNIAISGTDTFMKNGPGAEGDLFSSIIKIRDSLRGEIDNENGSEIDDLVKNMENITASQSRSGILYTRLELAKSVLETDKIELNDALSRVKDTDISEAMMNYNKYEVAYNMALNMSARILQTSLVDYM
ncbi:MAG: flagellar hook-associated protein 3 [Candidatus Cloacimonadota bacterium]|nr:MAG: flagellar hook-associated protein 3 [Candidatus Cloacimonadota bacterium]PIE77945.1 MAG: flagellar hook-associated protein 3 [Candidatus Delongbacteria bacterium]